MGYGNKTGVYGLPSIKAGEFINEPAESRAVNIIENQLIGAIAAHSGGHGVLKTGTFTTAGDSGGFTVTLSPNGGTPAVQAFIRFAHVKMSQSIQWQLLGDGVHSLYIKKVENSTQSTLEYGEVLMESSTDGSIPDDALLIAEATTSGNSITLNTAPSARLDISTISDHILDNINPHTPHLIQDQMFVSGLNVQTATIQYLLNTSTLINSGNAIFNGDVRFDQGITIEGNVIQSGLGLFVGENTFSGQSFWQNLFASQVHISSGLDLHGFVRFFEDIHVQSGITIDGRDLGQDGYRLDDHVFGTSAFINPHNVTAAQVSGIPHTGSANSGPWLTGNLAVRSGIAIDGVDVSVLSELIDRSNADHLHTHDMSGIQVQIRSFSPEYAGAILSGNGTMDINLSYETTSGLNIYNFVPQAAGAQNYVIVKRIGIPSDFRSFVANDAITLDHGISSGMDASSRINVTFRDTRNTSLIEPGGLNLQQIKMSTTKIGSDVLNTGVYDKGKALTVFISVYVNGTVGTSASIGDLQIKYNTIHHV